MKNTTKIFKIKPFFPEDEVISFPEERAKETADSLRSIGYDAKAVGYYVEVNANDDDEFELSRWGQIVSSRRPVKSALTPYAVNNIPKGVDYRIVRENSSSQGDFSFDIESDEYGTETVSGYLDKQEAIDEGWVFESLHHIKSSRKITSSNKYEFEIHDMDGYAEYPMTMTDAWGHEFDVSDFDKPYDSYEYWKDDVLQAIDDDEFVDGNEDYLDELYDYQNELCREYYGHNLIRSSRKSIKSVNSSRNEINLNRIYS